MSKGHGIVLAELQDIEHALDQEREAANGKSPIHAYVTVIVDRDRHSTVCLLAFAGLHASNHTLEERVSSKVFQPCSSRCTHCDG